MSHAVLIRSSDSFQPAVPVIAGMGISPRHDLYAFIHKALRAMMADTLQRVSVLDACDDAQLADVLRRVSDLVMVLRHHVAHEDDFVHAALEARRPGSSRATAHDHGDHRAELQQIDAAIAGLRQAPRAEREALTAALYRRLALLIADNLEHMNIEETINNPVLWADYDDQELRDIESRLAAQIDPEVARLCFGWMAAALNPAELLALFGGMQAQMPAPMFDGLLGSLREPMGARRHQALCRALNGAAEKNDATGTNHGPIQLAGRGAAEPAGATGRSIGKISAPTITSTHSSPKA